MFHFQDLASNSPYCLLYNSYIVTSENLLKTRDLFFFLTSVDGKKSSDKSRDKGQDFTRFLYFFLRFHVSSLLLKIINIMFTFSFKAILTSCC